MSMKRRRNPSDLDALDRAIIDAELGGSDQDDAIIAMAREVLDEFANMSTAEAWSTMDDTSEMNHPDEELLFWAEFGWVNAVNGDVVWHKGHPKHGLGGSGDVKIPRGYREIRGGGKVYSQEAELDMQHVYDAVIHRLKLDGVNTATLAEHITKLFKKEFAPTKSGLVYWGSDDGEVTQYARKIKK